MNPPLPPGQRLRPDLPRFGLLHFAHRMPTQRLTPRLRVQGLVQTELTIDAAAWAELPRVTLERDFHCVTGWSCSGLHWGGVRMRDVHARLIRPLARPSEHAGIVILRGSDGARTSLPLADLLAEDVLLADQLNGQPLSLAHGAPLRLLAPAHYGYKSIKYLDHLEFCSDLQRHRPSAWRFMDHPRARVAQEERGRWVPGRWLRCLYRPLIGFTVRHFEKNTPVDHP